MVFAVLFEVQPKPEAWDGYLSTAKALRPLLEKVPGFIDNVRYASLTRPGTILSLSNWESEKALVKWRTVSAHHGAQERGRNEILGDYHLRVGEVTGDSERAEGEQQMRFDETEVGNGKAVLLLDAKLGKEWVKERKEKPRDVASGLGFDVTKAEAAGAVSWDVMEAVLTPGDVIVMATWKDRQDLEDFEKNTGNKDGIRRRGVRVVRDYGMFDRREAPQYYPDAVGKKTLH